MANKWMMMMMMMMMMYLRVSNSVNQRRMQTGINITHHPSCLSLQQLH